MANVSITNTSSNISSKTVLTAEGSATVTGALAFNRSPSAPFTVNSSSAKVDNLDADKLDGLDSTAFPLLAPTSFTDQSAILTDMPVGTLVGNLFNPAAVAGFQVATAFYQAGMDTAGTVSSKVALFAEAATRSRGDNMYAANFVIVRRASDTLSNNIGLEIDVNNDNADVTANATPIIVGLYMASGGTKHPRSAVYVTSSAAGNTWRKGIEIVGASLDSSSVGLEIAPPTLGLTGTAVLGQIANNMDTLVLQRKTDTTPTGYLIRAINAANSAELFRLGVDGTMYWLNGANTNSIFPSGGSHVIELMECSADPAAGSTNFGRVYMRDNGSAKTQLVVRFPTGAIQVIATEP